jgi:hypothetical protein
VERILERRTSLVLREVGLDELARPAGELPASDEPPEPAD